MIDRLFDFTGYNQESLKGSKHDGSDKGNWTKQFQVIYTKVIGRRGVCFTFNFPTSNMIFNIDELSSDFIFNKTTVTFTHISLKDTKIPDYPLKTTNAELGMYVELTTRHWNNGILFESMQHENGYHLTFHDPFEMVSKDSPSYFAVFTETTLYKVIPNKFDYDDSIDVYNLQKLARLR